MKSKTNQGMEGDEVMQGCQYPLCMKDIPVSYSCETNVPKLSTIKESNYYVHRFCVSEIQKGLGEDVLSLPHRHTWA